MTTTEQERERVIAALKELQGNLDTEMAHYDADKALCDLLSALGYADVVKEWERVDKWYA